MFLRFLTQSRRGTGAVCGIDNSIVKQVMIYKARFSVVQGRLRIKRLENFVSLCLCVKTMSSFK